MSSNVLVAGIGNIFLGDDAFGVEVVNRLLQHRLPGNVCVVDYGIRSFDLAYALMEDWELVVLVDALPQGGEPGTLYLFEPEMPDGTSAPGMDAHTMNPVAVLQLVKVLGGEPGRIVVIGCEPATVEPSPEGDMGLSAPVQAAANEAVRMVQELIGSFRGEAAAA